MDRFSYEMVRALATDIVESCQDEGGFGGWSPIGRGVGWWVRVTGYNGPELRGPRVVIEGGQERNVSLGMSLSGIQ